MTPLLVLWSTFERCLLLLNDFVFGSTHCISRIQKHRNTDNVLIDKMSEYQTQVMDSESFAPANNSVNLEKVILQFKRLRRLRRFRHFTAEHFVQ